MSHGIDFSVLIIISFLTIAILASIFLKKLRFPYTIGLVIIGAGLACGAQHISLLEPLKNISLSPGIIMFLILPTLIFEASININVSLLYKNLIPILLLAVVGIIISAGVIGLSLPLVTSLTLGSALIFGALISATDPVAVIALFNEIKAPRRLIMLIDGESIFNDATAIVLFTVVSQISITKYSDLLGHSGPALLSFLGVLCGGILVGAVVGAIGCLMLRIQRGNEILQLTVTLIMAYISFIVADKLEMSGVISTLTAGVILSATVDYTVKRRHRETLLHFWEYFAFVANSFVFLLLGLTEFDVFMQTDSLSGSIMMILLAIPIIIIARVAVIYILIPLYNLFIRDKAKRISPAYQLILLWGGLRGAVPVALVLAIPESFPQRENLIQLTFGFILFTLLVQGTTVKKLMNMLGVKPEKSELEGEDIASSLETFPTEAIATLILQYLMDAISKEGFFIAKQESDADQAFIIKRRDTVFMIERYGNKIKLTYRKEEKDYIYTILYEALIELNSSVFNVKQILQPEQLKQQLKNSAVQESNTTRITRNNRKKIVNQLLKTVGKENLLVPIKSYRKPDVIREMLEHLAANGNIPDFDAALQALLEREKSLTTGIGDGIALPHAKIKGITSIQAAIGTSPAGVDFEAMDGKPVHIVVLILSPVDAPQPHIHFMATITKLLSDKTLKEEIIQSKSAEELYEVIATS